MQALIIPCNSNDSLYAEILKRELCRSQITAKIHSPEGITYQNSDISGTNVAVIVPGNDGAERIPEIVRAVREYRPTLPIAMLDTTHSEEIKMLAQLHKASYLSGPFSYPRLATELHRVACTNIGSDAQRWLKVLGIWLDLERRMVRLHNGMVRLRNKEFSLLEFFMINRGKILTRDIILEHVWDRNASFTSNTVDVHVNRLRKKIEKPYGQKMIHTVHCIGYLFDKEMRSE